MIGHLMGLEANYQIERNKITVINSQKVLASENLKGDSTMKKNCYRRPDGRWQYSKMENGVLYYAIAGTYRALLEKIPNIIPRQVRTVKTINSRKLTFVQYFDFYIENFVKTKKISPKELSSWFSQRANYFVPFFQNIYLENVTPELVQKFLAKVEKGRTQEILFQKTNRVLRKAYATGKIKRDVTLGIDKPLRDDVQERTPLTFLEQLRFLKAIKHKKIYTFAIFSIIVGSRREETLRFNLATDIDERKKLLHVHGTKTKRADRYVPVTSAFIEFLKKNMSSNTFQFGIKYPTKVISDIFKSLGIEKKSLHNLRHTCSANLFFLGASDKYRQMQLGHSSIVTTNNIYTNIKEIIPERKLRLIYGDLYPKFD